MHLGIRSSEEDEGGVANFREIAQSFWKESKNPSPSSNRPPSADKRVEYVGGHFQGTFTNKEIEAEKQQPESNFEPEKPTIEYKRYFD